MFRAHKNETLLAGLGCVALLMSCARSDTTVCADGLRCPVGSECTSTALGWACSTPVCGNGVLDVGELCDGGEVGFCLDYGYHLGVPACSSDCRGAEISECRDLAWREEELGFSFDLQAIWAASPEKRFAVTGTGDVLRYDGDNWRREPFALTAGLNDIWGRTDTDVFAVGARGTALRFDGRSWTPVNTSDSLTLESVAGDSGERVYAVASEGALLAYRDMVWDLVDLPGEVADAAEIHGLYGVAVSDSGEVVAVGGFDGFDGGPEDAPGLIIESSNDSWVIVEPPRPVVRFAEILPEPPLPEPPLPEDVLPCDETSDGYLRAVWSFRDTMIAVGAIRCRFEGQEIADGLRPWIVHRENGVWRAEDIPKLAGFDDVALQDIWGLANGTAFAVGTGGRVLHYDGRRWIDMTTSVDADLSSVWGLSGNDVTAVGQDGTILRFRGASLDSLGPLPGFGIVLNDISGLGREALFAAGQLDVGDGKRSALLYHDGSQWQPYLNQANRFDGTFWAVQAFEGGTVMAVGEPEFGLGSFVTICEEDFCADSPVDGDVTFYDLWGSSADEVFAVGREEVGISGVIFEYLDGIWTRVAIDAPAPLRAVWGTNRSNVYAVGDEGQLWHYDGASWQREAMDLLASDDELRTVWGVRANDVYAGGAAGLLLHYDGTEWNHVEMELDIVDIEAISGFGSDAVFALLAGGAYSFLRYDGDEWAPVGTPLPNIEHRGMSNTAVGGELLLVGADSAHRLVLDLR